ncbi:glycosyltransferase family 4 protein [Roseibium sp.]|uniref:glycosyltransferase family 4 protein n=1 Tax=Roseibium sp. TaxID=1936156 RepID=UPI003B521DA4
MKIAFTAPMKPLDDPQPSGDRTMGRLILKALEIGGHEVRIATRFRAWRKEGGDNALLAVKKAALEEAERIGDAWTREGYRPDLFLTYHLYHKAPDWIGPALADRFDVPYAVIEASRARKRRAGPWAVGFQGADDALKRADGIAALHNWDRDRLLPFFEETGTVPAERLRTVLPFLDLSAFESSASVSPRTEPAEPLKLLTVGMMRVGDKTASYEVLAAALSELVDRPWHLTIVGDGPNREKILRKFPQDRITWLGALSPENVIAEYPKHDLFVWPAIRESFGFVLLEAQASGLGVIAGDALGVPEIMADGTSGLLAPEGDSSAFAAKLRQVLDTPALARRFGEAARTRMIEVHSLQAGAERLDAFLKAALDHYQHRQLDQAKDR